MNLTPINKNVSRALLLTASLMTTIVQSGINLAYEYTQLTCEQRYHIYLLNKQGYSQTFIAKSNLLV
jgi:hypothetical protein